MAKDTFFCPKKTLNFRGKIINLSTPLVMGILNITPDSFFDGGKYLTSAEMLAHAGRMLSEGADIIDVGAASTRPGAPLIGPDEEKKRLLLTLKELVREYPEAIISVDTYNADTARIAIAEGAHMINDISAGAYDANMFETVAALQVPYCMMHIKGVPANMQINPEYGELLQEVVQYFAEKIAKLKALGIHDMIIDPGFGFGKTLEHNYKLFSHLDFLQILELPILVGLSRKSMINKVLNTSPQEALNGTTVLNTLALEKGAGILRVHDVREAKEVIRLFEAVRNA